MILREVNRVREGQKNVPKLRFKGYEDAWEQRKLGEVKDVRDGTHDSPKYISSGYPLVTSKNLTENGLDYSDISYISEDDFLDINQRSKVEIGDIIFGMIGTIGNPVMVTSEGFAIKNVALLKNNGIIKNSFLIHLLKSPIFTKYVNLENAGGTQKFLGLTQIRNFECLIPNEEEQVILGEFFNDVDHLITLHQRKYDALKAMKKTLLSKMFPKDGEDIPEIRFKGFTDAWEQRRLEEIFLKIRNAFVGTSTPYYVEKNQGGHFYIESNNVKHGKINHDTEVFINEEFYQNQKDKWLKTGDIVMVQSGHVGHSAVIPEYLNNSAAHALIMFQEYKIETNPYFINFQFQTESVRNKIDSITTGNTIKHILASDMKLFSISYTQKKEADKLGDFFISLDNLITLHQRKLEELKNMKKTLLQQMFV